MTRTELLRHYFSWCGERMDEELADHLRSIRWLNGSFVGFVLSWLEPMTRAEKKQFLSALLVRRWVGAYGDSVPSELLAWREAVDWDRFESAAMSWLAGRGETAVIGKSWSAEARAATSKIRKMAKAAGHHEERLAGHQWILARNVRAGVSIHLYVEHGRRGFAYWEDLRFSDQRHAVLRESFSSWFGVSMDTVIESFEGRSADEVADFVMASSRQFDSFVAAAVEEDR
jgi:hypothetical protein